jgi:hypothetical protein
MINGTDRTTSEGFRQFKVYLGKAQIIADATITERDNIEYLI